MAILCILALMFLFFLKYKSTKKEMIPSSIPKKSEEEEVDPLMDYLKEIDSHVIDYQISEYDKARFKMPGYRFRVRIINENTHYYVYLVKKEEGFMLHCLKADSKVLIPKNCALSDHPKAIAGF